MVATSSDRKPILESANSFEETQSAAVIDQPNRRKPILRRTCPERKDGGLEKVILLVY
jgi:hypothetical protein